MCDNKTIYICKRLTLGLYPQCLGSKVIVYLCVGGCAKVVASCLEIYSQNELRSCDGTVEDFKCVPARAFGCGKHGLILINVVTVKRAHQ